MKKLLASLKFALPISLVVAFVRVNRRGVGDLDSWWHVKIGDQLRAGVPFADLGKSWSLYTGKWQTSQWLSEYLMSLSHSAFGWEGLLWWRTIFGVLLLAVFVITLARTNSTPAVVITAVITAFVLVPGIQERPALIGMIFIVVLGSTSSRIMMEGRLPDRIWLWVPATALWANLHGSWILAPASLALASALALTKVRTRRFAARSVLLIFLVTAAGCLTPLGWRGLLLPFKLQSTAGKFIIEWQRTTLADPLAYGLLVLLALLIFFWARSNQRPSVRELFWVLVWTLFAFTAFRNVGPAILFIAPVAAHRLDQWFEAAFKFRYSAKGDLRTPAFLISLGAAVVVVALTSAAVDPLNGVTPRHIAERLSHSTTDLRIINDYNTSGVLLALGGDRVHLAVDGRADRFDPNWLDRYFSLIKQPYTNYYLLRQLNPNALVLDSSSPLIWEFIQDKHWKRVMTDGSYELITAPGLNLAP